MTTKQITYVEAIQYLNTRFEFETELRSYAHEVTNDGVFTLNHINLMDQETIIDVVNDLKWLMKEEIGYLL